MYLVQLVCCSCPVGVNFSPSQLDQDRLHGIVPSPVGQTRKLRWVDLSVLD